MATPTPIPKIHDFLKEKGLPAASKEQLEQELQRREFKVTFPLEIFHPKIRPYLEALHNEYDMPRSYIGLSMLSAYSSAVGSAYHVRLNRIGNIFFPVWACLEGISSAGKSLVMNQVFGPLYEIQKEMEDQWFEQIKGLNDEQIARLHSRQLIYGEAHIPTLIKDVMPHNPKGILQDADEILSWINGMNQLSKGGKEGTDEQFWMKSWNCKAHRKRLAGNKVFVIDRPFLNVFGGAQPSIMWKLFKNDRDTTGFIFRLLFAVPERNKIAQPNLLYEMPEEYESIHRKCINSLYKGLPMDQDTDSRPMMIDPKAINMFKSWQRQKIEQVNALEDGHQLEILAGIVGKMTEYTMRFCGLLHLADKAYDNLEFKYSELIGEQVMARALKAAEYFYESAKNISDRVNTKVIAPLEIIELAGYVKSGRSMQQIGDMLFKEMKNESTRRVKASRLVRKAIQEYPQVFGAEVR